MSDRTPAIHRASFDELDRHVLYGILRLRSEVFVVEQECLFLDLDGRDSEAGAEHLWVADDNGVAAAARLLDEADGHASIGRIVTRRDVRSRGLASAVVRAGLARLQERNVAAVHLGAQAHLADWYGGFGFVISGPEYVEDGIPHVPMARLAP